MTKQENNATSSKTIGRRDLLKALAAAGGAVTAASLLPGTWVKPVVEAGVIPAHAQTSGVVTINSLRVSSLNNEVQNQGTPGTSFGATFFYEDEACQVDGNTLLTASTGLDGPIFTNQSLNSIGAAVSSDPCAGTISFSFISIADPQNTTTLTVMINAGGRNSNTIESGPFPVI